MPTHKFIKILGYIILLFAIPFFLMVYCLRCERLRLSAQKRMLERLIEEQRLKTYKETRYRNILDISRDGF